MFHSNFIPCTDRALNVFCSDSDPSESGGNDDDEDEAADESEPLDGR